MTETSEMSTSDWLLLAAILVAVAVLVVSSFFPTLDKRRQNECNAECVPYQGKSVVVDDERRCYCLEPDGRLRPVEE